MNHILRLLSVSTLPCLLAAQGTIVSPALNATVEGTSSSGVPFNTTGARRTLQIHGDLGTTPRQFSKIAFRMNAGTVNYTGTRTIDMQLSMGPSREHSQMSLFYDANFIGTPTVVTARRTINFGPQGQAVSPGPNPFTSNMDLPFDAPFPYAGTGPIAWDYQQFSSTLSGTMSSLDGEVGVATTATSSITGTGCTCTGRTTAMTHSLSIRDIGGIFFMNTTVTNGPSSAGTFLAIGASNPNVSVPGLCSPLQTDVLLLLPIGTTSATGAITTANPGASTLVLPNSIAGGTFFTQTHSLDVGFGIPICNSNGRTFVAPSSNLTRIVQVSRCYNLTEDATAIESVFNTGFTVGFGVVTEFTYL